MQQTTSMEDNLEKQTHKIEEVAVSCRLICPSSLSLSLRLGPQVLTMSLDLRIHIWQFPVGAEWQWQRGP